MIDPAAFTDIWNRALGDRFPLRRAVADQFLSLHVSAEASRLERMGVVVAKQHGSQGWIGALVVAPDAQRKGLGSRLLTHAVSGLRAAGVREIQLGADYFHLLPGIPDPGPTGFFTRHGAVLGGSVVDLRRELGSWQPPEHLPRTVAATEWRPLLHFLERAFPGRWHWEAEEDRRRGGKPTGNLLLCEEGQVIGFSRIHYPGSGSALIGPSTHWAPQLGVHWGGLGPIGVAEEWRGRGFGLGLLQASMAHLRKLGVRDMAIDWTSLEGFYARAGFEVWKRYHPAHLPA
jgi:GNAT superfamily N-acetyltransferase